MKKIIMINIATKMIFIQQKVFIYMKKLTLTSVAVFVLASLGYSAQKNLDVSIDTSKARQEILHFAAADAWSGNFVGSYFEESAKGQVAKWLFSTELLPDGSPAGIGLSLWRVNVGGGSLEQDGADIGVYHRRAESFLTKDGKAYDWGKCAGQQYFMRKAREYGCAEILLFSNTPPVQMTLNGKGYGKKDVFNCNLKPECFNAFADFLADVAKHFVDEGFNVAYISPFNEPQANWCEVQRQEGSPWSVSEMARVIGALDSSITKRKLDGVRIIVPESSDMRYTYSQPYPERGRGTPTDDYATHLDKKFFSSDSPNYIGKFKNVLKVMGAHSYHTHTDNAKMVDIRKNIAKSCAEVGVDFWQTEWCMLPLQFFKEPQWGLTKDWYSDNHADMQIALVMARIIYADLVHAQAKSWGYWKAMEIKGDYALVGVYPKNGDLREGGVVRSNKLLWALGNYSRFIRPNFTRIELSGADNLNTVAASAYLSPDKKRVVAVFVNSSFDEYSTKISLGESNENIASISAYTTSDSSDLAKSDVPDLKKFVVKPRSVVTLVIDLK